jgi:hypothetical protein
MVALKTDKVFKYLILNSFGKDIMTNKNNDQHLSDIQEIYEMLKQNTGWARVTCDNIEYLKCEAIAESNTKLENMLRNWK